MEHHFVRKTSSATVVKTRGGVTSKPASTRAEPSTVPLRVHDVLRSPGKPLDAATRAVMEPRFGHDFSKVRVHTDARAADAASSIGAQAFTSNNRIVFGDGEYAPQTHSGRRLLAHELTHVTQQQAGISLWNGISEAGSPHERHAEEVANEIAQGSSSERPLRAMIHRSENAAPSVMRQKAGKAKNAKLPGDKEMEIGYIGKVVNTYGRERFLKIFAVYNPRYYSDEQEGCLQELERIAAGNGQNMNVEYFDEFLKTVGAHADMKLDPKNLTYSSKPELMELQQQVWDKSPGASELWNIGEDYSKKKLSTRQEGFLRELVDAKKFTRADFFEWVRYGLPGKPEKK